MMSMEPHMAAELTRMVGERTQSRVRDLCVEIERDCIVLRGRAHSFHLKQLAQHGVLDMFPEARVTNAIEVAGEF